MQASLFKEISGPSGGNQRDIQIQILKVQAAFELCLVYMGIFSTA